MNYESASHEELLSLKELRLKVLQCLHEAEYWEETLRPTNDQISR